MASPSQVEVKPDVPLSAPVPSHLPLKPRTAAMEAVEDLVYGSVSVSPYTPTFAVTHLGGRNSS